MGASKRVVVAMSGGVDSSVSAALLKEQGHEVIGVHLRFPAMAAQAKPPGTCCGLAGLEDARQVAMHLEIPFYVLNYERPFEELVIGPFCQSYAVGRTPNPCVRCNADIKFGLLLDTMIAAGADYVATGHYARMGRIPGADIPSVCRGREGKQEQSYFLCTLARDQIERALFPLGELQKRDVRRLADQMGLHTSQKPSSQDICFVGRDGYRGYLAERYPEAFRPGPIVDRRGNVLGEHEGVAGYTVGQRKGLGISATAPLYVLDVDAERNEVIVGPRAEGYRQALSVTIQSWLLDRDKPSPGALSVQTRYHGPMVKARVAFGKGNRAEVHLSEPLRAVAPGQYAAFYVADSIVGGGVIGPYGE